MNKTIDELIKGCDHDGSYIPVNEVKRLIKEFGRQCWIEGRRDLIVGLNLPLYTQTPTHSFDEYISGLEEQR